MIYAAPFVLIALLVIPAQDFLVRVHRTWHSLAKDDLKLAKFADTTVDDLAALTQGNLALQTLRVACVPALATGNSAALASQGQWIAMIQDVRAGLVLERASRATAQGFVPSEFPRFTRGMPDPCGVPGILGWPTEPRNFLRLVGQRAGVVLTSSGPLGESSWRYRHPMARPL